MGKCLRVDTPAKQRQQRIPAKQIEERQRKTEP